MIAYQIVCKDGIEADHIIRLYTFKGFFKIFLTVVTNGITM